MTLVMAQASTAEPVQVTVNSGPGTTDWINVALTGVLVLVTTVYVVLTGRMASEMKKQRQAAEEARLREKSDRAAYKGVDAVNTLLSEFAGRPPGAVDRARFADASRDLRDAAPLIADRYIRDKVFSTAEVLFVASFNDEQVNREGLDRALLPVVARAITHALGNVLHRYLAEQDVPENLWQRDGSDGHGDYYPEPSNAASWVRAVARRRDD